jgi:hypothetical protein
MTEFVRKVSEPKGGNEVQNMHSEILDLIEDEEGTGSVVVIRSQVPKEVMNFRGEDRPPPRPFISVFHTTVSVPSPLHRGEHSTQPHQTSSLRRTLLRYMLMRVRVTPKSPR